VVSGKLLHFSTKDKIDAIWERVGQATMDGSLSPGARVSAPTTDDPTMLLGIFVHNYFDQEEVARLLAAARALGVGHMRLKPEVFTQLGIYSQNCWGISPTMDCLDPQRHWRSEHKAKGSRGAEQADPSKGRTSALDGNWRTLKP